MASGPFNGSIFCTVTGHLYMSWLSFLTFFTPQNPMCNVRSFRMTVCIVGWCMKVPVASRCSGIWSTWCLLHFCNQTLFCILIIEPDIYMCICCTNIIFSYCVCVCYISLTTHLSGYLLMSLSDLVHTKGRSLCTTGILIIDVSCLLL